MRAEGEEDVEMGVKRLRRQLQRERRTVVDKWKKYIKSRRIYSTCET